MFTKILKKMWKSLSKRVKEIEMNNKFEEIKDFLADHGYYLKKQEKKTNPLVIVLAVVGAIATVAAIAYAVFYLFIPEDSEEFEDFEEEDFEDMDEDLEGDE